MEDVLSMTATEVSIIGNVRGGTLHLGDPLFLLGRAGKALKTCPTRIEDTLMMKMNEAEEGTNVSVVLDGLRLADVEQYDVLPSVNSMLSEQEAPGEVVNPYLTGLLREVKENDHITNNIYMGRMMEYMANSAMLLSPMMHDPNSKPEEGKLGMAMLRNGDKTFLPAFTDIYELEKASGIVEKLLQPLDFDKAKEIIANSSCDGLALNPSSDAFVIPNQLMEMIAHQKKNIQNGIREQKLNADEPIMLAIPKEGNEPKDLLNAVKEFLVKDSRILKAWYGLMVYPKTEKRAHLIIVDTLEEDQDIFGGIGRAAKPFVEDLPLNMQTFQKVGEKMTEKLMMFYERKETIRIVK